MTFKIDRRSFLAGSGAAFVMPTLARPAGARQRLVLELGPREIALQPGEKPIQAARFAPDAPARFVQCDTVEMVVTNRLTVPASLLFRGLDGAPALQPVLSQQPIAPGATETSTLTLAQAGTLLCDLRLGGGDLPLPVLPIVLAERTSPAARDEVLLIEDWRPRPDSPSLYTLNGTTAWQLRAAAGERLRLRFVNGAHRAVLAAQLPGLAVRVIAIDGQPSEVFPARDGRILLAPGTRIDAVVDLPAGGPFAIELNNGERTVKVGEIAVTGGTGAPPAELAPLPSNGLPEKMPLQSALRVDVPLGPVASGNSSVVFRVKRGRTVVLALNNPGDATTIFHLHGHHMRLLDRLDDGWKPFWLNTLAVPAKMTLRVAFAASNPGAYLIETTTTAWASPVRLRSYVVEP